MIDLAVAVVVVVATVLHVEAADKTSVHQLLRLQEVPHRQSVQP
jgi:hypothetical protein